MDSDTDWLREILRKERLEDFYTRIRDELQITRLAHFDYVREDDLEKIGISKPAIRRLLHAIKKENMNLWAQRFRSIFGASSKLISREVVRPPAQTESRTAHIISEQDITLQNVLGKGSFAVVRKGEWRMSDSGKTVPVAVKVLKNGVHDDFGREVAAMHRLHHHNLMKLYGVVFQPYMMVCELAPKGALLDYIKAQKGRVSLSYIAKWSEQVAAGMAHLARNRFLHRDLACRNILLSTLDLVKIGDFGLMRALPDGEEFYVMDEKHRERMPLPWCAPESLRNKQFSLASDVWMYAVALWEMYSFGAEPWTDPQYSERGAQEPEFKPLSGSEIRQRIENEQRLPAPGACPHDVYMLLMQCWKFQPSERPTFQAIQRYMESNKIKTAVAALSYRARAHEEMTVEAGDEVVLIDKRPDLLRWKGQNLNTLEVGLFPSNILKTVRSARVSKIVQVKKKIETSSPSKKVHTPTASAYDDSAVVLRNKRRTIESTQPHTTRAFHADSKQINYNKLTNDRTVERDRLQRDAHSKSLNQVKEGLLIDIYLPPTPKLSAPPGKTPANNISILDQPIDVPEANTSVDWGEPSADSLPTYSQSARPHSLFANLHETKSLDNLTFGSQALSEPDPFDTSQWAAAPQTRPTYDLQGEFTSAQSHNIYSNNSTSATTSSCVSEIFYSNTSAYVNVNSTNASSIVASNNGRASLPNNSSYNHYGTLPNNFNYGTAQNNSISNQYGTLPNNSIVTNGLNNYNAYRAIPNNTYSNVLSIERNGSTTKPIAETLTELSLDDRISESLNLRSNENIYANTSINDAPATSAEPGHSSDDASYGDIPIYGNFPADPAQRQHIYEQKDFYSKGSTASENRTNGYDKNIYTPKNESEKLQKSESLENSKNYSAAKYQNSLYGGSVNGASTSRAGAYDFADDAASNFYSEINDNDSAYGDYAGHAPRRVYDDVCEASAPRPHRPAPPRPYRPS